MTARTEEELAQTLWWWRRTRFLLPPEHHFYPARFEWRSWCDGLEQTAFEYELVRRVCKTRQLAPFIDLDCWLQSSLQASLCPVRKKFTVIDRVESIWQGQPGEKPTRVDDDNVTPYGLSEADADGWRLNLEVTDNQLLEHLRMSKLPTEAEINARHLGQISAEQFWEILKARKQNAPSKRQFLAWINRQRAAQGITPPRSLRGQRNRAVSWRWIELLDIAKFKIKRRLKDTDSERQTKRRARVMALKLLPKYLKVLDFLENLPSRPKEKLRPKPLMVPED